MASDKSGNSNNSLGPNVKIKVEPGASLPVPVQNIKTEPGLSALTEAATKRLTSFRLPRDLTLGGNIKTEKPKKVYTPNLNAQRSKKKDDAQQNDSTKSGRGREHSRGRGRGNSDRGRDRGRGRGSSNLIQSTGIWSTGAVSTPGKRYSGGSRESSDSRSTESYLQKPKLELNRTVNKAEEEEKLKLLLRDDFIDDEEAENSDNGPIELPMSHSKAKQCKQEAKVKIKEEPVEEEEEVDRKPIILENGEAIPPKKERKPIVKTNKELKEEPVESISDISENKSNAYILMQFPDCLPGLVGDAEDTRPSRSNAPNSDRENESKSETEYCVLNSIKAGMIGKVQIMKSGKARLILGENNLVIDVGSNVSFRQDLIAAKLDSESLSGELINLGQVNNTLVCSPDWETMLARL